MNRTVHQLLHTAHGHFVYYCFRSKSVQQLRPSGDTIVQFYDTYLGDTHTKLPNSEHKTDVYSATSGLLHCMHAGRPLTGSSEADLQNVVSANGNQFCVCIAAILFTNLTQRQLLSILPQDKKHLP